MSIRRSPLLVGAGDPAATRAKPGALSRLLLVARELGLSTCVVGLVLAAAGCSGSHGAPPPRTGPPAAGEPSPPPPPASQPAASVPTTTERAGVVTRAELETHLRDGAQSFIQKVRVRPAFRGGRFLGWRVLAYEGPGPIRIGDVVMRVNGEELERPDQFMKAWNGLRGRSDLVVEMIRAGKRVALRFPIVD